MNAARDDARLRRQIDRFARDFPALGRPLRTLASPGHRLVRIPVGMVLVFGGLISILPLFSIWMLPIGLLLIAVDVPPLKRPVAGFIIHSHRWLTKRKRRLI